MGTDIIGWVEIQEPRWEAERSDDSPWFGWQSVVRIDWLVERNYYVFDFYFGVRNRTAESVAPGRGVPPYACPEFAATVNSEDSEGNPGFYHSHTWIAWNEIVAATDRDRVIGRTARGTDGSYRGSDDLPPVGTTWATDKALYRVEPVTLGDELDESGFSTVIELMAVLARRFGPGNVRLCVAFYN